MKKQAFNPYLPSWEYVPDGEPYVFEDRVYVYGSHDLFNGLSFCLGDYVCWSAPVDDLANWRYEGCIYHRSQDPAAPERRFLGGMAAPDMVKGPDGRYYLYYFIGGTKRISVAVCDEPAGHFEFYGYVHYQDGTPIGMRGEPYQFDPGCLLDEDGRLYLYTGFAFRNPLLLRGSKPTAQGPMWFELDPTDMLTVVSGDELRYLGVPTGRGAKGTDYEGHEFAEASSMRRFGDRYYFIYSSMNSHDLCYAVSDRPTGGFTYGGVLISNGDIGLPGVTSTRKARNFTGNTHGSLIQLGGDYFVFYHRHSNRKQSSRQACAERIRFEDGRFHQAELTSCGLNRKPLEGVGTYPAYIACNLWGRFGTRFYSMIKLPKFGFPYFTQDGKDRNGGSDQYIANMGNGAVAGFKYFDLTDTKKVSVTVQGDACGTLVISTTERGAPVATIPIRPCRCKRQFGTTVSGLGVSALYFRFEGWGTFRFYMLTLK